MLCSQFDSQSDCAADQMELEAEAALAEVEKAAAELRRQAKDLLRTQQPVAVVRKNFRGDVMIQSLLIHCDALSPVLFSLLLNCLLFSPLQLL